MVSDSTQPKVWIRHFSSEEEYKTMVENLQISTLFNLRYRGLMEFYGEELIQYAREKMKESNGKASNNQFYFLEVIGSYFTDYLEDLCPASWWDCRESFWEELIFVYYPYQQKMGDESKVECFFNQLNHFVRWLDQRKGTSWYPLVNRISLEAKKPLISSSRLFTTLFTSHFPRIHHDDWDPLLELERLEEEENNYQDVVDSFFQIIEVHDDTIILKDLYSFTKYNIRGLPIPKLRFPLLLHGTIGRKAEDTFWEWHFTEGVFPERARQYIKFPD